MEATMKIFLILIMASFSTVVLSKSVSKRQVDDLERRILILEQKVAKLAGTSMDSTTGLRTKDANNNIQQAGSRGISSAPEVTETQRDEIMKTLEGYKKKKAESQKLLDELMNEDF
jgi:hypothetical protein